MLEGLIITVIGGLLVTAIILGIKKIKNIKDTNKIYNWLEESANPEKGPCWRSTRAIASATHMTEERVRILCSHNKKIVLSTGEKEIWSVEKYVKNQQQPRSNFKASLDKSENKPLEMIKPQESKYDPVKIDKILEIYDSIKNFIAQIQMEGTTDNDNLIELFRKTKHTNILFKDKEISEYVDLLYHRGLDLEYIEKQLHKTSDQKRREELAQKSHDLFTWFSKQHETVDRIFKPFLNN